MADDIQLVYLDLTGAERRQVHHALLDAFDRAALAEMISFDLDQRLDAIAAGGSLSEVVLSLIGWAEQQGRILALMQAAVRERPGNEIVASACQIVEARAAAEKAKPKQEPADAPPDAAEDEPDAPAPKRRGTPTSRALRAFVDPGLARGPSAPGTAPIATLGLVQVTHNLPMVPHPQGLQPGLGMSLALPGVLSHAAGRTMQIVIRFVFPNGAMLYAAPQERAFRDATGCCAVGTMPTPVVIDPLQLDGFVLTMPYYVLNLTSTNGMMAYQLSAVATVYVDNAPVAQSMPTPFQIRW